MSSSYRISKKCNLCEDCVSLCPTESIFFGAELFVIDSDTCHGCGVCAQICPVQAIQPIEASIPPLNSKPV